MSKPNRGIRAQRTVKAANRWQATFQPNKKGRDPRQGRPFEDREYDIVKPSREARQGQPE